LIGGLRRSDMDHRLTVDDRVVSLIEWTIGLRFECSKCKECGACRGGGRKSVMAVTEGVDNVGCQSEIMMCRTKGAKELLLFY
jgi:hypothetical protein